MPPSSTKRPAYNNTSTTSSKRIKSNYGSVHVDSDVTDHATLDEIIAHRQKSAKNVTRTNIETVTTPKQTTNDNDNDETQPLLDPANNPQHAQRIKQRTRMIQYGKNTAGYDNYLKQVPKHTRKPRSMKCPATPNVYEDIPTRRWQGQVKAWRKALHQYDPPDLMPNPGPDKETSETKALAKELDDVCALTACSVSGDNKMTATAASSVLIQAKEIEDAEKKGLQVEFSFGNDSKGKTTHHHGGKTSKQGAARDFDSLFASTCGGSSSSHVNVVDDENALDLDSDSDDDLI